MKILRTSAGNESNSQNTSMSGMQMLMRSMGLTEERIGEMFSPLVNEAAGALRAFKEEIQTQLNRMEKNQEEILRLLSDTSPAGELSAARLHDLETFGTVSVRGHLVGIYNEGSE